jgi:hypothetical protein
MTNRTTLLYYILNVYDFIYQFFDQVSTGFNRHVFKMQEYMFDGFYIKYSIYDTKNKKMHDMYNYESLLKFMLFCIRFILGFTSYVVPIQDEELPFGKYIHVGTYINNGAKHHTIGLVTSDEEIQDPQVSCVFCLLNDEHDLTHEFNKFKHSIYSNKDLTWDDLITILTYYFDKPYRSSIQPDCDVKVMFDDTYDELVFKGNTLVNLHNGES